MKLIVVSGRSGSGKTTALHILEDIGFYCVDNLPLPLLKSLIEELQTRTSPPINRIAVGVDARNSSTSLDDFPVIVEQVAQAGLEVKVLYLDAQDRVLIKRFSETRRRHPVTGSNRTLKEAIEREQEILAPVMNSASQLVDTSDLSLHDLRDRIKREAEEPHQGMTLLFQSFGFKRGVPTDADMVFDVRCLPNPHWISELRQLTGLDEPVQAFLQTESSVTDMIASVTNFLIRWLPDFEANNRSYTTIAIGCTGGQHRSVFITEALAAYFRQDHANVQTRHRDL